jgi:hypothetical protein
MIAPVSTERRLHAASIGCNEAGDGEDAAKAFFHDLAHPLARLLPLHGRSERSPLHDDGPARVDPLETGAHTATFEIAVKKLGRPDLPEACDQVAHVPRRRARELDRVQDAGYVVAVAIERREVQLRGFGRQQLLGERPMPLAHFGKPGRVAGIPSLRKRDELQERVRDASARREHHGDAGSRL